MVVTFGPRRANWHANSVHNRYAKVQVIEDKGVIGYVILKARTIASASAGNEPGSAPGAGSRLEQGDKTQCVTGKHNFAL